jgi:hypothetical protein
LVMTRVDDSLASLAARRQTTRLNKESRGLINVSIVQNLLA